MIFLSLFITFFKIGLFTFGGGYAMLPLIFSEVEAHGWLSPEELINFVAVSESTPGPFAINIATYIGTITAGSSFQGILWGVLGAVCATLGVVLPSFIIILIISSVYEKFKENKIVAGIMSGLKPAVIGLIAFALVNIASTVFLPQGTLSLDVQTVFSLCVTALMTFLSLKKVHPIIVILLSAALGIAVGYAFGL